MPEFIKTAEVVGNIAQRVYGVGKFVVDRLAGGGWDNLPHGEPRPARPPQRANISYYSSPEAPEAPDQAA